MKTVYVVYDRYERDEFYQIYSLSLRPQKKKWRECVRDFLSFGPDDCHTLYVSRIVLDDDEYEKLTNYYVDSENGTLDEYDEDWIKFMSDHIYCNNREEQLYLFDISDIYEMGRFYLKDTGQNPDDEDELDSLIKKVFDDDKFFNYVSMEWLKTVI